MTPRKLQLRYQPTAEEIAHCAAVEWLGLLKRRPNLAVPFGIALSGGRIAGAFYKAFVEACGDSPTNLENVHFFWADERCVPASDPENNYAIARQFLFEPLNVPATNVHRIRGDVDATFAVGEAEAELCRIAPLTDAGQPVLDLIILGMGEDGHVASLFPSEGPEWIEDNRVYRKVIATKPPPARITLGYQPIITAREVWVLASGAGKKAALELLLAGDQQLPISRVVSSRASPTMMFQEIVKV
jgi:6-phosphogluconolactonase